MPSSDESTAECHKLLLHNNEPRIQNLFLTEKDTVHLHPVQCPYLLQLFYTSRYAVSFSGICEEKKKTFK